MKKHSEKIYKSLPEVVQKKEELKKENIKKTNLLMANIFKKVTKYDNIQSIVSVFKALKALLMLFSFQNLQKKTLRGSINLSNYSTVVKI